MATKYLKCRGKTDANRAKEIANLGGEKIITETDKKVRLRHKHQGKWEIPSQSYVCTNMKKLNIILFVAIILVPGRAGAQNLILNPGFETGDFTDWTTGVGGGGSFTSVNGAAAHSGSYGADMGGYVVFTSHVFNAGISQTVSVAAGETYDVSFWIGAAGISSMYSFSAYFGNDQLAAFSHQYNGWQQYSFTDIAGGDGVLSFAITGIANQFSDGLYLDDVSVTAVPEPSPIIIAGTGVIALGMLTKRRIMASSSIPY